MTQAGSELEAAPAMAAGPGPRQPGGPVAAWRGDSPADSDLALGPGELSVCGTASHGGGTSPAPGPAAGPGAAAPSTLAEAADTEPEARRSRRAPGRRAEAAAARPPQRRPAGGLAAAAAGLPPLLTPGPGSDYSVQVATGGRGGHGGPGRSTVTSLSHH